MTTPPDTNAILNQVLVLHHRSLPVYLSDAVPWFQRGDDASPEVMELIVAGHNGMVERIGQMILDGGGAIGYGDFPMRYTSFHDLSFEYLRHKVIEYEQQMIAKLADSADQLRMAPTAQAVVFEAMGEAKAHLQSLEELAQQPAATDA